LMHFERQNFRIDLLQT